MKKILVVVSLLLASTAYAAPSIDRVDGSPCGTGQVMQNGSCITPKTTGFTALAPISGLTDQSVTSVVNSNSLATFFNNLYKYLIGLAAILAVIEIIWGGLEISTKDSISKQSDGKNRIRQAIWGLVLILSPVIVFSIINPSILNLSLNLPPLDTKANIPVQVQQKTQCDDPALTPQQKQDCLTLNSVRQTGLYSLTQEQIDAAQKSADNMRILVAEQERACRDRGGKIISGNLIGIINGECGPLTCSFAKRDDFTSCDVLVNKSACLSNSGKLCPSTP
jgi:hypothetical protein